LGCPYADTMVVDHGSVALHQVHQTVVPVKPLTQSKQVTTKGKAVSCPATQLWACKVTQVTSPTPEVAGVMAPTSPVSGLTQQDLPTLFKDPVLSGDAGIGGSVTVTSGEFSLTLCVSFD